MNHAIASDFTTAIARRLETAPEHLADRWFDELGQLPPLEPDDIFPGGRRLAQVPVLIQEFAALLRASTTEFITANAMVTARATELGRLRHAQHASLHHVLQEYRVLRAVLAQFIEQETADLDLHPTVADVFELTGRIDSAIDGLLQTTVNTFVAQYTETITQHTRQLESFYRMVSHELRQPLATVQFAVKLLQTEGARTSALERERIIATCDRNVGNMSDTLAKLVAVLRDQKGVDSALVKRVDLATLVRGVVAQLVEMADARDVLVEVVDPLPSITVDVARLELILVNVVSNAIKYSDPEKLARTVKIDAALDDRHELCAIRVRDNGIGIAEVDLPSIFSRFRRGHEERDGELRASGLGLGLSIVAECVQALAATIHVESTPGCGTVFSLEVPMVASVQATSAQPS
jgi:signal transduction histidine kinase